MIAAPNKYPSNEIIYNASHTGRAFEVDNKEVNRILYELSLGTEAAISLNPIRRICAKGEFI